MKKAIQTPQRMGALKIKRTMLTHLALAVSAVSLFGACKVGVGGATFTDSSSGSGSTPAPTLSPSDYVAGIGATLPGTGALSVPTGTSAIQRIIIGVGGRASTTTANTKVAYQKLGGNLGDTTDPTQMSGGDSNMLLAYAACADANGAVFGNIKMTLTTSQNKAALVAMGMKIMDTYTAGLASGGSASAQLNTVFSGIVDQSIANGATPQMAYITVCTAAVTAGSTMLGF